MEASEGQFVWYDLMTHDVDGAKAFYSETIGWKMQAWEGAGDYTMLMVDGKAIGGIMALPAPSAGSEDGHPPHWIAYVAVDDVDAKGAEAVTLGGKLLEGPNDIPEVGRFSVIADPEGAVIAIFKAASEMAPHGGPSREGNYNWHELNTTNAESAWTFYSKLFGWEHSSDMDMGPEMGNYRMFRAPSSKPDHNSGGMCNAASFMDMPPSWLHYVTVADLDGALKRITDKGGKIMMGPKEVPGGERIAVCVDPQGANFAIHEGSSK